MVKPEQASKNLDLGKLKALRKKIEILKELMRPPSPDLSLREPTVEFGHEFSTSYNRHTNTGAVKRVIYNPVSKSYVSYNEKQLHIWRANSGATIASIDFFDTTLSHSISCMCYARKYMIYLVVSTDFKIHIFNELLIWLGWLPLKVRLVNFIAFNEERS